MDLLERKKAVLDVTHRYIGMKIHKDIFYLLLKENKINFFWLKIQHFFDLERE